MSELTCRECLLGVISGKPADRVPHYERGIDRREIAKVRKGIKKKLFSKSPPMLENGGYIPHIEHSIPPDIAYDDFMHYIEQKLKLTGAERSHN